MKFQKIPELLPWGNSPFSVLETHPPWVVRPHVLHGVSTRPPPVISQGLLGLASSPYETSTVCPSVRQSVHQTKFSYFPPLEFLDFWHEDSL